MQKPLLLTPGWTPVDNLLPKITTLPFFSHHWNSAWARRHLKTKEYTTKLSPVVDTAVHLVRKLLNNNIVWFRRSEPNITGDSFLSLPQKRLGLHVKICTVKQLNLVVKDDDFLFGFYVLHIKVFLISEYVRNTENIYGSWTKTIVHTFNTGVKRSFWNRPQFFLDIHCRSGRIYKFKVEVYFEFVAK